MGTAVFAETNHDSSGEEVELEARVALTLFHVRKGPRGLLDFLDTGRMNFAGSLRDSNKVNGTATGLSRSLITLD